MKFNTSLYALSFLPLANAWTFLYTNATGAVTILHNTGPKSCTPITLAANQLFSWDPEGQNLCVSIYRDSQCTNRAGLSCGVNGAWKKDASANFYGVAILDNFVPSSTASSTPSSTSTTSTLSTTTSSTTSSSSSPSSSSTTTSASTTTPAAATTTAAARGTGMSSSLSGGAIAGIVIGVLAAVALIAALFFFRGRRNRTRNADSTATEPPSSTPQGPYTPQSPMTAVEYAQSPSVGASEKGVIVTDTSGFRPAPGSRVVELPGDAPSAELVNSPISELEGQSGAKHFQRF